MSNFSAELQAFDLVYNDMVHSGNPSSVGPLFVQLKLIDPSLRQGRGFILPNESMEIMLRDVRSCIALDGTNSLKKLFAAFAESEPSVSGRQIARGLKENYEKLIGRSVSWNTDCVQRNVATSMNALDNTDLIETSIRSLSISRNVDNVDPVQTSFRNLPMSRNFLDNVDPVQTTSRSLPMSRNALDNVASSSTAMNSHTATTTTYNVAFPDLRILDKDVSMDVVVMVAPVVADHWNDIGYRLKIDENDMVAIEAEVPNPQSACKKVLRSWIRSTHGKMPKTWRTFLKVLRDLKINCDGVIDKLRKEENDAYS